MTLTKKLFFSLVIGGLSLAACASGGPEITGYSIDDQNNIVVIYSNGTKKVVGSLSDEDIANHVNGVSVNNDGNYVINGVDTGISAINAYIVTFDTCCGVDINSQKVLEGHKVIKPSLTRTGYDLEGWYCNGEKWSFNSDVVLNNMELYAVWSPKQYTLSFNNEMGENPENIVVEYDKAFTLPSPEPIEGYTFVGWFNGDSQFKSGTWRIDSDLKLDGRWHPENYTVILDPGVGSVIESTCSVVYGEHYKLPVPTNDYGVFTGWLCDGIPVTDAQGYSLEPWNYTEDKTFTYEWEIKIYNTTDLYKIYTFPQASFKLMNDIDMTGIVWLNNNYTTFTGRFDGNGHAIRNLSFDTSFYIDQHIYSLFPYTSDAIIKNLWMDNFTFKSSNIGKTYYVGGIYGLNTTDKPSVVQNCRVTGSYSIGNQSSTHQIHAGGICAMTYNAFFTDCVNEISMSNATYAGGLTGFAYNMVAVSCLNKAEISANTYGGGLVGNVYNFTASLCINTGKIYGKDSAGGIAGWVETSATIDKCVNNGTVGGDADGTYLGTGGIVGACYGINSGELPTIRITRSYNSGEISSKHSGGIAGASFYSYIDECYNCGLVEGSDMTSGIVGATLGGGSITQTLASGNLNGVILSTLTFTGTGITSTNSFYTYSTSDSWYRKDGTHRGAALDSDFYINSMFWSEYNPMTREGIWVFSESGYPVLYEEESVRNLPNRW